MLKRYIFALVLVCLAAVPSGAVNAYPYHHYFIHIDRKIGLSQNDVKTIVQDSQGFMWFGTRNRLNRYDGNSIRTFDCHDTKLSLRNNNVSALMESADHKLWVGTDKGVFIMDPKTEKFTFLNAQTKNKVKVNDWISAIAQDKDGSVWIIAPNQGIFRYAKGKLESYAIGNPKRPITGTPQCMCIDKSGRIWVGTNGSGVWGYNREHNNFTQYLGNSDGETLHNQNIYRMCDYGGELIIGVHEGKLRRFDKRKNTVKDFDAPEVHYKIIREVKNFDGELWIGTQDGVFIINELDKTIHHIHPDPMSSSSLSDNQVGYIYRDREDGIWIGTNLGGISFMPRKGMNFVTYTPLTSPWTINSKRVRELAEDNDGNIWVGTEDAGINIFNPNDGTFKVLGKDTGSSLFNEKTLSLTPFDKSIWVGLFKNGLDVVSEESRNVKHYSADDLGLNEASVYAACEDSYGKTWIGNAWGVYVAEKGSMKFQRMDIFGFNYIYDIMEDADKNIWVVTMGNGVFCYTPRTKKIVHYLHDEKNTKSLSSNSVSSVTETSKGEIWFSTDRGGICKFNKNSKTFTTISIAEGLPDDTGYKILEDENGFLWFGTNNGIVKYNPENNKIVIYNTKKGYPCGQFNYKSALHSKNGIFYFGTSDGLISFDPNYNNLNDIVAPVFITRLFIDNKEILPGEESILSEGLSYTKEIELNYDQTNIRLEFAALSFVMPTANIYKYMLDGVDTDWITTTDKHEATYSNLSPGTYTFRVMGANSDGVWNKQETTLKIKVLPPWWKSTIAIIFYILCIAGLSWYIFNRTKKREREKATEKNRIFEIEKEKELFQQKIDFFTSIAHEIRTPVTLINGPLENLKEMDIVDSDIKRDLNTMSRNTNELMALINQLLDFRKLDNNKIQPKIVTVNLSALIRDRLKNLDYLKESGQRNITYETQAEDVYVLADRNVIIKILNNMFTNAVKYSESIIKISIKADGPNAVVKICNDGNIVPQDLRDKIFESFYQLPRNANAPSSTGIGLYISRQLAESINGKLRYLVDDNLNCFELILNIDEAHNQADINEKQDFEHEEFEENNENGEQLGTILVVEDNEELLKFLAQRFLQKFSVEIAHNGKEALEVLSVKNIDVIVSDIMMPEMDGIEMCKAIKENIEICHIPIVLLTAKTDLDSKIAGVESGADAYVVKPFSFKYLMAQVTAIAENRKRDKEAFMHKPFVPTPKSGMSKSDAKLMENMVRIIEENIDNSNFSVEMLAELAYMSRSSLHRKIKAITGTSPTDFIKLIRLKKASELIAEGSYRVGEVCYMVGINSPSYFIRLFQKQFGLTPKEFEKQIKNQKQQNNDNQQQ
ncbi:MAG: two-component regulator propeller domain-containing protein [Bacteroidales bacterium]|nr:two-component regulator propeller domain-containing protein [Bacteroidales bacterium]